MPGERGDRTYESIVTAGEIELDEKIWIELQAVADSVGDAD